MLTALAILVMTPSGWQAPAETATLQVKRGTSVTMEPASQVAGTDRVYACDTAVTIGSHDVCAGHAPNRTDDWWLKSEVLATPPVPVPTGTVTFSWDTPAQNTDGSPLTDLAGYYLTIRLQDCDELADGCFRGLERAPLQLGLVNSYVVTGVKYQACARIRAYSLPGNVGPETESEVCKVLAKTPGLVPNLRAE